MFGKISKTNDDLKIAIFTKTFEKIETRERCKGVHRGESFPTSIFLQILASIQPRTGLAKFARSPCTDPPALDLLHYTIHHPNMTLLTCK